MSTAHEIGYGPGVRLIKNVRIPMRDNVHLGADLYVPDDPDDPAWVIGAAKPILVSDDEAAAKTWKIWRASTSTSSATSRR